MNGELFTVTDATGLTTTYRISTGLNYLASGTNAAAYTPGGTDGRGTTGTITIGVAGLSVVADMQEQIFIRINAGTNIGFSAAKLGSDVIIITQGKAGASGNKANENIGSPSTTPRLTIGNFTGGTDGANDKPTQDRTTGSVHVIRTRFSAPGGPEVNSPAYLDVATQQFSVYNSMNFRNLTVVGDSSGEEDTIRVNSFSNRREGLRILRARHQGQFGIDSKHGTISSTDYVAEASFHKQHRNTTKIAKGTESGPVALVAAMTITTVTEHTLSANHDDRFTLTDSNGVTTTFKINAVTGHSTDNGTTYSAGTETDFHLVGLNSRTDVQLSLITKINKMNPPSFTATSVGQDVLLTQNVGGTSGNTEITFPNGAIAFTFSGPNSFTGGIDAPTKRRDNMHFNTPIPASDFQYSWINAAISGSNWEADQKVLTYAPKNGMMSSSIGFTEAIIFPTISDISCCADFSISIKVVYEVSGDPSTVSLTDDATLEVVANQNDATAGNGKIWKASISGVGDEPAMIFSGEYSGCCDTGLQFRIVAVHSGGTTIDSLYQSTPPTPPNITRDTDENPGSIVLTFYAKDCLDNVETLIVTLQKAKFA